jgi:hypothetical protein
MDIRDHSDLEQHAVMPGAAPGGDGRGRVDGIGRVAGAASGVDLEVEMRWAGSRLYSRAKIA